MFPVGWSPHHKQLLYTLDTGLLSWTSSAVVAHSLSSTLIKNGLCVLQHSATDVTQITHLFITVLDQKCGSAHRDQPNQWAHRRLKGVIRISKPPACLFIVLSQRPCANGSRGGLCCVGCSLHKICACGAAHSLPTGNHGHQLEPWLAFFPPLFFRDATVDFFFRGRT